jgi:hypothetical protein
LAFWTTGSWIDVPVEPIELTDTGLFTTTPLPPPSGRAIPQTMPRRLRKQSYYEHLKGLFSGITS